MAQLGEPTLAIGLHWTEAAAEGLREDRHPTPR